MIGKWFKRKLYNIGYKAGYKDFERILLILRGFSKYEIAVLLINATLIRLRLEVTGVLPAGILDLKLPEVTHDYCLISLNLVVKQLQKDNELEDAAAAMIWLHSLRAQTYIELRIMGREMWKELSRGFELVEFVIDGHFGDFGEERKA